LAVCSALLIGNLGLLIPFQAGLPYSLVAPLVDD